MKKLLVVLAVVVLCAGCAEVVKFLDAFAGAAPDSESLGDETRAGAGLIASILFGSVGANILQIACNVWTLVRGKKYKEAVGQIAVAIEANRSDGGHEATNAADQTAVAIKALGNSLIDKVVAKVTK